MSVVPLLVNLAHELESHNTASDWDHMLDDDFGFGLYPMDIFRPRINRTSLVMHPRRRFSPYMLTRRNAAAVRGSKDSKNESAMLAMPTVGKDGFQVCMDVSQFKPNELTVKTVDKTVVVEGKHEEREDDHGMIQRHFVRKYTLPKDFDPKEVVSTISSDGVLTVKAPPPASQNKKQKERIIQIQQTGPAHLSVKANEQNDGKADENGSSAEKMETGK